MALDYEQMHNILMPRAASAFAELSEDSRFVHYTSAQVASKILQEKQFWMRNASCMTDFSEVEHGLGSLISAYRSDAGISLKVALDAAFDGLSADFEALFDSWQPSIRYLTYITCLSKHSPEENDHGRLSMWRAYGRSTGVGIVITPTAIRSTSDVLKAYSHPVIYQTGAEIESDLADAAAAIGENIDAVREFGRDSLKYTLFNAFVFLAVCTKHPGFHEEREWRVVHCPKIFPSDVIEKGIETINGVPQTVYKIPLRNYPDDGLVGMEIPELVDRIIIGPTEYPVALQEAFVAQLEACGVEDAGSKVVVSGIPLRT